MRTNTFRAETAFLFYRQAAKFGMGALLAASALLGQAASATEAPRQTMEVTLTVLKSCSFTTQPLAFGEAATDGNDAVASTTLQVTCSNSTPYNITTENDNLEMQPISGQGGSAIPFSLYSDEGRHTAISTSSSLSGSGSGSQQTVNIYGKVAGSVLSSAHAGNYKGDVKLVLTY